MSQAIWPPQQMPLSPVNVIPKPFLLRMNRATIPFDVRRDSAVLHEDKNRENTLEIEFLVGGSIRAFRWSARTDEKTQRVWGRWLVLVSDAQMSGVSYGVVDLDEMAVGVTLVSPPDTPENENLKNVVSAMLPGLQVWEGCAVKVVSEKDAGIYLAGYGPAKMPCVACVRARLGMFAQAHGLPEDATITIKQYKNFIESSSQYAGEYHFSVFRVMIEHGKEKVFLSDKTPLINGFDGVIAGLQSMIEHSPQYRERAEKVLGIFRDITAEKINH